MCSIEDTNYLPSFDRCSPSSSLNQEDDCGPSPLEQVGIYSCAEFNPAGSMSGYRLPVNFGRNLEPDFRHWEYALQSLASRNSLIESDWHGRTPTSASNSLI